MAPAMAASFGGWGLVGTSSFPEEAQPISITPSIIPCLLVRKVPECFPSCSSITVITEFWIQTDPSVDLRALLRVTVARFFSNWTKRPKPLRSCGKTSCPFFLSVAGASTRLETETLSSILPSTLIYRRGQESKKLHKIRLRGSSGKWM
jgi:hypothetical protein